MSLRLSDYWHQFFDFPLQDGGSPYADSTDNQLPAASTVPALAPKLLNQSTTSAPASTITRGISTDQLQALAQALQTLASWHPSDSGASEAMSYVGKRETLLRHGVYVCAKHRKTSVCNFAKSSRGQ